MISEATLVKAAEGIASAGYACLDNALPSSLYLALGQHARACTLSAASVSRGGHQPQIRGDQIAWLDGASMPDQAYLRVLDAIGQHANRLLYTGICRAEAHYARYGVGDHYQRHRDNRHNSKDRALSTVLYLNHNWQTAWGGALILETDRGPRSITPQGNRLIVFDSRLWHAVQIATQPRWSIAGWLRRDSLTA